MNLKLQLKDAILDLRYLLERGYPRERAVDFIGDRYRLKGKHRNLLYRCVFSQREAWGHIDRALTPPEIEGERLCIDGYNVLITVESCILGREFFMCDDGFTRDISGVYGKYRMKEATDSSMEMILRALKELKAESSTIYFDSAVSFSGELARRFREEGRNLGLALKVRVVKRGDARVKSCRGIACSSDRAIIEDSEGVFDLGGYIVGGYKKPFKL